MDQDQPVRQRALLRQYFHEETVACGQVHSRRLLRQADYLSTCVPTATAGKQRSEIRDQRSAWSTSRGGAATYGRTAPWGAKLPMQSILRANLIPSVRLNDIRDQSCPFIEIHLSDGRPGQNPNLRTSADGVPLSLQSTVAGPQTITHRTALETIGTRPELLAVAASPGAQGLPSQAQPSGRESTSPAQLPGSRAGSRGRNREHQRRGGNPEPMPPAVTLKEVAHGWDGRQALQQTDAHAYPFIMKPGSK